MNVEIRGESRWSFARMVHGFGPIRIAVPAWRMPRDAASAGPAKARLSQEEVLDLFHIELRTTKRIVKQPDSDFTKAENLQRQSLARVRSALYTV